MVLRSRGARRVRVTVVMPMFVVVAVPVVRISVTIIVNVVMWLGLRDCRSGAIVMWSCVVRVIMCVIMCVPICVPMCLAVAGVGAVLRLERQRRLAHDQVHGAQHVRQHMVGLDLEVVGLQFYGHMPVAQVVGGADQVEWCAVFGAVRDPQHGLGRGDHTHQRSVFHHQHITATDHSAARQEHAEYVPGRVGGVEAALLAYIPVELDAGRAFEQDGCEPAALGNEFVGGEHGAGWTWKRSGDNITIVITREVAMAALKLTQIGNSVGVILPKELLARLKVEKGDMLFWTEAANGVNLSAYSPDFEAEMSEARRIMKKRKDVLRELAK